MNLPSHFTKMTNVEYSKTIKTILTSGINDREMFSRYGYGLMDLAVSLHANRPNKPMSIIEFKDARALNNSVKRFITMYTYKK
jgi:hypothetical protein